MVAVDLMTAGALALIGGLGTRAVTRNLSVVAEEEGIIKGLEHDENDNYGKHAAPSKSVQDSHKNTVSYRGRRRPNGGDIPGGNRASHAN